MQSIKQVWQANDGKIFYGSEDAREQCEAYERELFAKKRREALGSIGYKEIDIAEAYHAIFEKRNYAVLCTARPECEDDFVSIINLLVQYWHPRGMNEISRAIPKCPCAVNFIVYQSYKHMHVQVVQSEVAARFTDHTATRTEKEMAVQKAIEAPSRRGSAIEYNGKVNSMYGWCKELGISASTVRGRMKRGLTFKQAVEMEKPGHTGGKAPHLYTYNGETNSISGWARTLGINVDTLSYRLKHGVPFEQAINPGRLNATGDA